MSFSPLFVSSFLVSALFCLFVLTPLFCLLRRLRPPTPGRGVLRITCSSVRRSWREIDVESEFGRIKDLRETEVWLAP